MSFGIEKQLGTAIHYLLLGHKGSDKVAFQERDGTHSAVPLRQLVRWPARGTDNQRALGLACGYLLGIPQAREQLLDHFRQQALTDVGLDFVEPLSAAYGHAHMAAAAASLVEAIRVKDPDVHTASRWYLRRRLGLALLHADGNGFVHSPGARCGNLRSEALDIGLQTLLELPLDPSVNHAKWWDPTRRRAAFAEAMRMLARHHEVLLSKAEVRGALAWIGGDLARGEGTMRRLLAGARLSTSLLHLRAGARFSAYFPILACWDNPQPAVTLFGGKAEYLTGMRDQQQLWPKNRPTETRLHEGRIEARFIGQLGVPTAPLTHWRASIADAAADHTLSICVGPKGATWDSEPLAGKPFPT